MKCIKRYCLIFSFILFIHQGLHAGDDPGISFKFENVLLIDALDNLIYKQHIPIIYIKNQVDSIFITEQCYNCTPDEALKKVLKNSVLKYKKVNHQFVLYNPKTACPDQDGKLLGIEGRIVDSLTREPLPYASIVISRLNKGSASNDQGIFKIDNLPPDIYKLKIIYVGYTTDSILVDLRDPGKSSFWNVKLSSKTNDLAAVTIKTFALQRNNLTSDANASTIDPKLLKTIPTADPGDIVQNIKLLPGISALPDNLGGFNLRGGTMDQTLVQIDGIPLFHSGHLWGFNSSLNADAIESIKVQSGGFSASYGDRLSGVVDMKGHSAGNDRIHFGILANLFSSKAYVAIPITKKASIFLSGNTSTNFTGLNDKILNRQDYTFSNQYMGAFSYGTSHTVMGTISPTEQKMVSNYYDLYGKLNIQLTSNDSLSISCVANNDKIAINSGFDAKYLNLTLTGERIEKWKSSGIAINHSHYWKKNISTNFGIIYADYTNTANFHYQPVKLNTDITNSSNLNANFIKQLNAYTNSRIHLSDNFQIMAGLEYNHIHTGFERTVTLGIETYVDSVGPLNALSNKVTSDEWNGFAENQLTVLKRVKLTSGIRLTYNAGTRLFLAEPRINSKIEILKGISLQASWGMFHQNFHTSPSVIAYNISSFSTTNVWLHSQKGLDPSKAQHWMAGINLDRKKWSAQLSAYYKKYSNLAFIIPAKLSLTSISNSEPLAYDKYLDWLNNRKTLPASYDSVKYFFSNDFKEDAIDYFTGSGYSKGIEIFISKKYGVHTGFISYHLSSTRYRFSYINMGNEFAADYDRTHELKIMNSLTWHGWNLGCVYTLASGKPYVGQFKVKSYYIESHLLIDHPIKWDLSNTQRTPVFQSVDLSISKRIDKFKHFKLLLGTSIQNVFDRDNILGKFNTLGTDPSHNNLSVLNEQLSDQKGTGRFVNFFINVDL